MTDHPINLRDWQVSAAVEGRLSVLVVPILPQPTQRDDGLWDWANRHGGLLMADDAEIADYLVDMSPLIVGERYWARETFCYSAAGGYDAKPGYCPETSANSVWCRATDSGQCEGPWRSSTQLPRWASRITIVPTEVRVCRLHEVTEDEARRTGVDHGPLVAGKDVDIDGDFWPGSDAYRRGAADRWAIDHGPGAYERNPWVAVGRAAVHLCNIDTLEATR